MKRFTNSPHLTSSPSAVLIKPILCRRAPRHSSHLMQAQQSLFQSAFKDPNQRAAHGVKKSIPFLNLWAPSQDVQRYQEQQKRDLSTMASATSFYDFKPLDSTCGLNSNRLTPLLWNGVTPHHPSLQSVYKALANHHRHRERRRRPPRYLQGKGRLDRQHGVEMRLHAPVPGPRVAVQEDLRLAPRPVRHPRLPL
jgi:peroxiredoxin